MSKILEVKQIDPNALVLHTDLANGQLGEWKFRLISAIPNHTMICQFSKGKERKSFSVSLSAIMECIVDEFESTEK